MRPGAGGEWMNSLKCRRGRSEPCCLRISVLTVRGPGFVHFQGLESWHGGTTAWFRSKTLEMENMEWIRSQKVDRRSTRYDWVTSHKEHGEKEVSPCPLSPDSTLDRGMILIILETETHQSLQLCFPCSSKTWVINGQSVWEQGTGLDGLREPHPGVELPASMNRDLCSNQSQPECNSQASETPYRGVLQSSPTPSFSRAMVNPSWKTLDA